MRRAASEPPLVDVDAGAAYRRRPRHRRRSRPPARRLPEGRRRRIVVALTQAASRTRVLRGENGGEELHEAAIVRALSDRVPLSLGRRAIRFASPRQTPRARPGTRRAGGVRPVRRTSREIAGAVAVRELPPQRSESEPQNKETDHEARTRVCVMLAVAVPSSWTLAHAGDDMKKDDMGDKGGRDEEGEEEERRHGQGRHGQEKGNVGQMGSKTHGLPRLVPGSQPGTRPSQTIAAMDNIKRRHHWSFASRTG